MDLRDVLERRRSELEAQRGEIERRLRALEIRVETASRGSAGLDVVVRPVAEEPVATLALDLVSDGDVGRAFYELEAHVRDLGRRAPRPPGALVPSPTDNGEVEIFVPVTRPLESTERIAYWRLPAVRAATVIHRGPYRTTPTATRALEDWVDAAGLTRAGPMRILYLQFGAERELNVPRGYVVERAADYVTELQLPVA